jgi:hypothetical protein
VNARWSAHGRAAALAALVTMCLGAGAARAALAPELLAKLHPRLLGALQSPDDSVSVWIEFGDKGESGPADLAAALARAEAELTPRARARRIHAGVHPLVDYLDLPVSPRHLDALRARGAAPRAVSRWFNRAAVMIPGGRLGTLAELECVGRIVPVARARLVTGPVPEAAESPRAVPPPRRSEGSRKSARLTEPERTAAYDYGRTFDQLAQLRLPELHACGFTGRGVLVCVIDEGFTGYTTHEALRDQPIAPGHTRDFVDGDTVVVGGTILGHGTWVLGLIAANRFGSYVGAAFGAEFALARTENSIGESPVEMLYWGMGAEWADSLGAQIINSSLGYFQFTDSQFDYTYEDMDGKTTDVTRAAQIAVAKGILVVNSIGNEGNTTWRRLVAPADVNGDSLIAVGAVDAFGDTAHFSSAGPTYDGRVKPDLVARGVSNPIVSTFGGNSSYSTSSGTSFAAPLVTGLAACLMEARPTWTATALIQALRASASQVGNPDNKRGYGFPDAIVALHGSAAASGAFFHMERQGPQPVETGPVAVSFGLDDPQAEPTPARLRVVDSQGRALREVWSGTVCFGQTVTASWDGRLDDGTLAPSGVYWLALHGGGHVAGVRVIALR